MHLAILHTPKVTPGSIEIIFISCYSRSMLHGNPCSAVSINFIFHFVTLAVCKSMETINTLANFAIAHNLEHYFIVGLFSFMAGIVFMDVVTTLKKDKVNQRKIIWHKL